MTWSINAGTRSVLDSIRTMQNWTSWHVSYIFLIKNIFKKLVQKISSHSDAQKGKQKSALILLLKKINIQTDPKTSFKLVHFIKYKTFFGSF